MAAHLDQHAIGVAGRIEVDADKLAIAVKAVHDRHRNGALHAIGVVMVAPSLRPCCCRARR